MRHRKATATKLLLLKSTVLYQSEMDPQNEWQTHQYEADETIDPNAWRDVPNTEILAILAFAIPVYLIFYAAGEDFKGFFAALSVGVVLGLTSLLRKFVREPRFWVTLLAIAIVHAIAVYLLPNAGNTRFGMALTPFVVADLYVCAKLLSAVCTPTGS